MSFITANQDPAKLPNQSMVQEDFDLAYAEMISQYPVMGGQMNALAANMSAYAAGGAYAFGYGFDSSTADADPGPGKLRFNSATQGSATRIMIDPVTLGGGNIGNLIAAVGANLSLLKGAIRVVKAADPTRWMIFDINSTFAASGYYALAVTFVAASSANPFSNGDALQVFLDRTGDRAVDLSPMPRIGGGAISNGTINIDYLNLFSDDYYRYQIELTDVRTAATGTLTMRLAIGGVVNSGASSYAALVPDGGGTTTRVAQFSLAPGGAGGTTLTIDIRGARASTRTSVGARGRGNQSNGYAVSAEGFFDAASVISGFRLYDSGGSTFTGGQIDIYGYRKV